MTSEAGREPFLVRQTPDPGVHVLIVAVGRYDSPAFGPLPGARATARRLAEWWIGSEARQALNKGQSLASLDVLVSDAEPLRLARDDGTEWTAPPARMDIVRTALRAWCARSGPGSTIVLHWIGHGEVQGEGSRAPVHALYGEDQADGAEGPLPDGLDWNETVDGIAAYARDANLVCSIDTCKRRAAREAERTFGRVFGSHHPHRPQRQAIYTAVQGRENYCLDPDVDAAGDFSDGGALMSEAVLMSLDRFGALFKSDEDGPSGYPETVKNGAEARLERWKRQVPILSGLQSSILLEASNGRRLWPFQEAIVRVPMPMSMMDIKPRAPTVNGLACKIGLVTVGPVPTPCGDRWQVDADHGDHHVEIRPSGSLAKAQSKLVRCSNSHHVFVVP